MIDLKMKLSPHFTLGEMIRSSIATRHNIDNTPPHEAIERMKDLCNHPLEWVRTTTDSLVFVLSGYRNKRVNKLARGSNNSQHMDGTAADIIVPGVPLLEVYKIIIAGGDFDQVILEFGEWVHVSWVGTVNRREALVAKHDENGDTIYLPYGGDSGIVGSTILTDGAA